MWLIVFFIVNMAWIPFAAISSSDAATSLKNGRPIVLLQLVFIHLARRSQMSTRGCKYQSSCIVPHGILAVGLSIFGKPM